MAGASALVVIERDSKELSQPPHRVYVTGPHFGEDIYSSTRSLDDASRFARDDAERLLPKWRDASPRLVEVEA